MLALVEVIRLQLELHFTGDTVTGEVRTAAGAARPFQGWIGLIAAIELEGRGASPPTRPTA
jgi:hypothetical protein